MNKNIFQSLKIVALASILSIGISYVSAWTAPTATPPNGNVAAPVNVSSTAQTKPGDFSAWNLVSNGVVTNNAVVTNSIAGNTVATNNLVVATGAAAGKVLTSDASGNATWQPASGGASYTAGNGLTLTGNTFSTNTTQTQARVTGSCSVGSSISSISATGAVTCQIDNVGAGGGNDNLGNHTATQALKMNSNYLYGLPTGNAISWGSSAGTGNSIYSDGAGGNMAARMTGMFYVQNTSGGNANMSAQDYYAAGTGKWTSQLVQSVGAGSNVTITGTAQNPVVNATGNFGGMYTTYRGGVCHTGQANPLTGGCSCPVGFSGHQLQPYYGCSSGYDEQCFVTYCYK